MGPFFEFALVGFGAQLVDGALGMGFGVISSAVLIAQGVPPPLVSASVNAAKLPTSGTSALSHYLHGNVDWRIVRPVVLMGALGGVLGALLLISLKGVVLMLLINLYLLFIGGLVILRALRGTTPALVGSGRFRLIGFSGGAIEGIGGSWGPIVSTGLLSSGVPPRQAVGSSNLSEFVVSGVVFSVLFATYYGGHWGGDTNWRSMIAAVSGLVAGGLPAAVFGGYLARRVPRRPLTFAVGLLALGIGLWRLADMVLSA